MVIGIAMRCIFHRHFVIYDALQSFIALGDIHDDDIESLNLTTHSILFSSPSIIKIVFVSFNSAKVQ
jgi:hypothetical protein